MPNLHSVQYGADNKFGTMARNEALFEHAPPINVQQWLGLAGADRQNVRLRALLVALVGWAPLVLLVVLQAAWTRTDTITSLFWEVGVHARYLLAAPLLVMAEALCAPHLNKIVHQFTRSFIVNEGDRPPLADAVHSTRRMLASGAAELAVVLLAYAVVLATILTHTLDQLPIWARPVDVIPRYSLAGWWHMLVSLPLLLILILGWFWRLVLWARLLWKISRLNLHLVASHPDRCAGLSFLGHSVRAFAVVASALAIIVAARSAHVALEGSSLPTPHLYFNIGFLTTIVMLFVAPLLVFTAPLMEVWRRGTFEYDLLADRVGRSFEKKWLDAKTQMEPGAKGESDFSETADFYSIVANVHSVRFIPIDIKDILTLIAAILIPFLPVVFLAFPSDVIWTQIKSLLL